MLAWKIKHCLSSVQEEFKNLATAEKDRNESLLFRCPRTNPHLEGIAADPSMIRNLWRIRTDFDWYCKNYYSTCTLSRACTCDKSAILKHDRRGIINSRQIVQDLTIRLEIPVGFSCWETNCDLEQFFICPCSFSQTQNPCRHVEFFWSFENREQSVSLWHGTDGSVINDFVKNFIRGKNKKKSREACISSSFESSFVASRHRIFSVDSSR